ncbi:hypothetical protein K501DRAFT_246849 [Backusella circina FSU 941]|nr:hypothetical protein K501DRAFT_246849 [Backusella circina FSU 941]
MSVSENTLAIVSSVLFPTHPEGSLVKRRKINLQNLPGAWIEKEDGDDTIDTLKETIAHLRKETERLEETDMIVKKSIQIVTEKRLVAQSKRCSKLATKMVTEGDEVYIMVAKDFVPTQEEMIAAGIESWEWVTAC